MSQVLSAQWDPLCLMDGILYRRSEDKNRSKYFPPDSSIKVSWPDIMNHLHCGNLGEAKTLI